MNIFLQIVLRALLAVLPAPGVMVFGTFVVRWRMRGFPWRWAVLSAFWTPITAASIWYMQQMKAEAPQTYPVIDWSAASTYFELIFAIALIVIIFAFLLFMAALTIGCWVDGINPLEKSKKNEKGNQDA